MPTITFRLSDNERATLEAAAARAGRTMSDYIRGALAIALPAQPDLEDHERRLKRIEALANLD